MQEAATLLSSIPAAELTYKFSSTEFAMPVLCCQARLITVCQNTA